MGRRAGVLALIGGLAFALVAALRTIPGPAQSLLQGLEWQSYDWHLRESVRTKPLTVAESPVVIVAITDDTPINLTLHGKISEPFETLPRGLHAELLRELQRAGVKAVAFDLLFRDDTTPALDLRLSERAEEDKELAEALAGMPGAVVATRLHPPVALAPLTGAAQSASVELAPTSGRSVRTFIPWSRDSTGRAIPHVGTALAGVRFPKGRAALDEEVLLRYAGPAGTIPTLSYEEVCLSEALRESLRGKRVLIGNVSDLEQRLLTPLGEMTELEVLANITLMTLTKAAVYRVVWKGLLAGGLMGVLFLGLVWRLTLAPALVMSLLMGGAWVWVVHVVFVGSGYWWETATPLSILGFAVAVAAPYEIARAHRAFRRQVSPSAAHSALTGRGMQLGTREVYVTVVFCDIRGFTSYCETHTPDEIERLLRAYFEAGDQAAQRHGSELDKFIGDAILLYFFERRRQEPGAVRAVRWAWEMQKAAAAIGIEVGVGIASGTAREGFIGTAGRMQRTVIGDVVNLSSRLQEATKSLGTPILLSPESARQAKEALSIKALGEIEIRGKKRPVAVFHPEEQQKI